MRQGGGRVDFCPRVFSDGSVTLPVLADLSACGGLYGLIRLWMHRVYNTFHGFEGQHQCFIFLPCHLNPSIHISGHAIIGKHSVKLGTTAHCCLTYSFIYWLFFEERKYNAGLKQHSQELCRRTEISFERLFSLATLTVQYLYCKMAFSQMRMIEVAYRPESQLNDYFRL